MPTALVTGASSGIGLELAKELAREGFDLILVARREERLQALAFELQTRRRVQTRVMPLDLAKSGAAAELFAALEGSPVDLLVNNAGFADFGPFAACDETKLRDLIEVNIVALTELTRLFLPPMLERKHGRVLNVASTAAFFPGPLMSAYYASKAYVLSFSEALACETRGGGVTVTCLCPGATTSEFQDRAAMKKSRLMQGRFMPAWRVARRGVQGTLRGQEVVVPGLINQVLVQLPRVLPRREVTKFVRRVQEVEGDGAAGTIEIVRPPAPDPERPLALVTGASSGIGRELAREFARRGFDLAIVARGETGLRELAAELGATTSVTVIPLDLERPDAPARLRAELAGRRVDVLVNNAGFGDLTRFAGSDPVKMTGMIRLNVVALTLLCREFLPEMLARGSGRIVNVGSMAAFSPGPLLAVYYATKAYVLPFTEALANETEGTGVTVTCLSPGLTHSQFMFRATTGYEKPTSGIYMDPAAVAKYGVGAALRGEVLAIPGIMNRIGGFSNRLFSRRLAADLVRRFLMGSLKEGENPAPANQ